MRRHLPMLVLAGLIGSLALVSDARACCHKKRCAPVACAAPAPAPEPAPAPVCEVPKKKCCFFKLFGHRRCCKATVVTYCPAPVCTTPVYAAPVYAAPQVMPAGQGS